jgi:hypothetical protein
MPTLTSSTFFTVANQAIAVDTVQLVVVPAGSGAAGGYGRLVHPTLGTLDYTLPPHEWTNLDSDVIISPTWTATKTLTSTANTLWAGALRDVVVKESWLPDAGLSMPMPMLRLLIAFFLNPPDLAAGQYVEWYPTYSCALGFKVILEGLEIDGEGLKMTPQTKYIGLCEFPIALKIRPVSRLA